MAKKLSFTFNAKSLLDGLEKYKNKAGISASDSEGADLKAKTEVALSLLKFVLAGSSKEAVVPPIMFGVLRGSGSVFVGNKLIGDSKAFGRDGRPNTSYSAKPNQITIGFNTAYAARMHEHLAPYGSPDRIVGKVLQPGPTSQQSGDTGGKYLERHLQADGETLVKLWAELFKKYTGG